MPSATTPCPSRNRAGGTPVYCAGSSSVKSVTVKWMVSPSCRMLSCFTSPPRRIRWSSAITFCVISEGVKKKTRFSRNAFRISNVAATRNATPKRAKTIRWCLGDMAEHQSRLRRESAVLFSSRGGDGLQLFQLCLRLAQPRRARHNSHSNTSAVNPYDVHT